MKTPYILGLIVLCSCGGSTLSQQGEGKDSGADAPVGHDAGKDARRDAADAAADAARDAPSPVDAGPTTLSSVCDHVPGLTGQAVLDALHSPYSATYTPVGTASTPTALTITAQYNSGKVTCHPAIVSTGGPPDMPAWVEVVLQMTFVTADGLFNESFSTGVALHSGSTDLSWDPVVLATDIKGTFKPTLTGPTVDLSFGGTFSGSTTSGLVEQQKTSGGGGMVAGAGTWK